MADQGSEGLLSPFLRTRRIEAAKPYIKGSVLDIGCGVGYLADFIRAGLYLGVDIDEESLCAARKRHPHHTFISELPPAKKVFNSVVGLAVLEHAPDPLQFLSELTERLHHGSENLIICTTPLPALDWIHSIGTSIGLFSREARKEHQKLLGYDQLKQLAAKCSLDITLYRRFLLGANQLFILRKL
jgi:2-polyprenyl-3-methyl-5-hydroxy-6-metoxy-1,4-benzoquinol methylase